MKTGNKIALFYSAITIGVIAVVTLVFYWVSTSYISRLYYSYLTEKAYATAQKHWEKDETDDESYARIQQRYEETLPVATEILLNADSLETRQVLSRYLDATQVIPRGYRSLQARYANGSGFVLSRQRGEFHRDCPFRESVWDGYPASDRLAVAGIDIG